MLVTVARDGREIGRYPQQEIRSLLASGGILPSDDYWHEGMPAWRKVSERWPVGGASGRTLTPALSMKRTTASRRSGLSMAMWAIGALLLVAGVYWYLYVPLAPDELVAVAPPSEETVRDQSDQPDDVDAPPEEPAAEQGSAPAPEPEVELKDVALAWLQANPQLKPQRVSLQEPHDFPLTRHGRVHGRTTLPAGASANLDSWDEETITAGFAAEARVLPHAATDFVQQVVAIYQREKERLQAMAANSGPPNAGGATATPQLQAKPKILVVAWNIQWFPGRSPEASTREEEEHMEAAKKELEKLAPDIFLAQEISGWRAFNELCSAVSGLKVAVVSHHMRGDRLAGQQTAIASKLPVTAAWYDDWKPGMPQPPRGYSAAVVEIPGSDKLLLCYSIHLRAPSTRSSHTSNEREARSNYQQREEAVRQLLDHVKEMERKIFKGRIAGVIVGGGFNTNHDGQFEDKTLEMLTGAGFINPWKNVPPNDRETWMGSERNRPSTLDYVMTKGLGPAKATMIGISRQASDHHPVALEITLPSP